METKTYKGLVSLDTWNEADDILYVSSLDAPLAEILEDEISGRTVTARYWITDKETTKEEAQEAFVSKLLGRLDAELNASYSETTGYLWTDEKINIGGHDLLEELQGYAGKWLILEIDIHD